jgi:hypothetical protein
MAGTGVEAAPAPLFEDDPMTPQSHSDTTAHPSAGAWLARAAACGVATPRPRLLLLVLMLIAACIVVLTGIDLATMSAQIASIGTVPAAKALAAGTMRSSLLNSSLFIAAFMGGMLALIAFGHGWARWVWMLMCMLFGALVALGSLVLMFDYAPSAAMAKCLLYLLLFVLSCMLFAPSGNAWFRQIKEIRNNPRLHPARREAAPAHAPANAPAAAQPHDPYAPPGSTSAMPAAPQAIAPRPPSITLALALFALNALLGVVLSLTYLPELLAAQTALLGIGMLKALTLGGMAVGLVLVLLILYFIARGSNAGRWTWTVMAVIGLLNAYAALTLAFGISPLYGALLTLSQLISLSGTILLFVPASNAWIRQVSLARGN